MNIALDLNLDAGEDLASLTDGSEARLYALVTRVSIACGGHAGDAHSMRLALDLAARANVLIGAHPSYPDREGFGRSVLNLRLEEIERSVRSQIASLKDIADIRGITLSHVKPHGALYHQVGLDERLARAIARTVQAAGKDLVLVGPAGSPALALWKELGVPVLSEGFIDRGYLADGKLAPRSQPGSLITDPEKALAQARELLAGHVVALTGERLGLECRTLCVHGDNPAAEAILSRIVSGIA